MSLLTPAMNFGTFPCPDPTPVPLTSVNAAAIDVTTSITSSCASAHANAASMHNSAAPRAALCTIAGINLNVLLGEIARPETRAALGFALDRESNQAIGFIQLFLQLLLRKIRGKS